MVKDLAVLIQQTFIKSLSGDPSKSLVLKKKSSVSSIRSAFENTESETLKINFLIMCIFLLPKPIFNALIGLYGVNLLNTRGLTPN